MKSRRRASVSDRPAFFFLCFTGMSHILEESGGRGLIKTKANTMARIKETPQTIAAEMRKAKSSVSVSAEGESKKRFGAGKIGKFVFWLLFLCAVGAAGYYYYQYRKATGADQAAEIKSLTTELGKVMDLPSDETPTLATVTDKEKLASQPFFRKSENGDKVLIYVKAGKAILYRPSNKKIIDVSTVNIANNSDQQAAASANANTEASQTAQSSQQAEGHPTLALYNGAKTLGLTYKVEDQIKSGFANVDVMKKEPAAKTDYAKTVVVDVSGKYALVAGDIAKNLSAEVKSLPDGEAKPDADILVIIGEDKAK